MKLPIRIDPRSPEPLFEQLTFQVKHAIAAGQLHDGDRLPSVREMAKDLAINPNTVVRAIEALEREGVIVRRHGSGCFVTSNGAHELSGRARRDRLDELMSRAVTEAFHLGHDREQVRAALERHLETIRFEGRNAK